jgi:glycosidase
MYWGEGNVATYTDKIDKTMQSSVGTVARQSADANSILSTYRQFAQARNTYPALASGTMSAHSIYNDRNTAYKQIAAWYMTSGSDKMLVIHNLAKTETIISITDAIKSAVVVLGTVSMKKSDSSTYLKLGANSSVVFEL